MTQAKPLQLCWWETEELLEHLASRSDLWTQSSDDSRLWLREETRGDGMQNAFALLIIPPAASQSESPFRLTTLQLVPLTWEEEHAATYLRWLLHHWTSYRRRDIVAKFLVDELRVDPGTAPLAAIAIEGLSWTEDESAEPTVPPLQEELWPSDGPSPQTSFREDPTLIGTFVLNGGGFVQLRHVGGLIRTTISIPARNERSTVCLQGFSRPLNGRTRDAAALIGGWVPSTEPLQVDDQQPKLGDVA